MDGRLLALAREEKERIRAHSIAEDERRHREAYRRRPELRAIDDRLRALVGELAAAAMGEESRTPAEIQEESLDLRARRAELLVGMGLPMDWLDGAWDCPKCRDTGSVLGRTCDCVMKLYERERARDLSALFNLGGESFESFRLDYYSDTPRDQGPSPRAQMAMILDFCRNYAQHFGPHSLNLLLRGSTGLGKTFLSACIARVVSEKGFSVVYETAVDALGAYEDQKFRGSPEAEAKIRRMLSCDLLILDDLGTEMVREFTVSALYALLNARLLSAKPTIVSTNLTPEEMERTYTPQICSRLQGEYQDLPFAGRDIRLLRKEQGF